MTRRLRLSLSVLFLAGPWLGAQEPAPQPPAPQPPAPTWRGSLDDVKTRLAGQLFGLQVSAFGDGLSGYGDTGKMNFKYDAAEVDVQGDLTHDLQMALAVVRFADLTKMTVGFLDYHPFGGQIAPRGQLWVEKGFHVQVGRFDVPFGNDFQFNASKDSISISRPLTTTEIMDGGYNDAGVRVLGNDGTFNFNTYLLQGFVPGRLLGGRVGFTPFGDPFSLKGTREPKVAEVGFSYFYDGTSKWEKREAGWALDLDGRAGPYYARLEYLDRTLIGQTRHGWHFTQEYLIQDGLPCPTTFFARYERVAVNAGRDERVAAGLSANIVGVFEVKVERQHFLEASLATRATAGYRTDPWYLQFVVVF